MNNKFTDHILYGSVSEGGEVCAEIQVILKPVSDVKEILERSDFFIEDKSEESIENRKNLKSLMDGIEQLREESNSKLTELVNIHVNTNDSSMVIEDSDYEDSDDDEEEVGDRNIIEEVVLPPIVESSRKRQKI